MSKVVLHIGTHKTATTTIQDTFWANAGLLAKHGLIYPRLTEKHITGHHGLVCDWARLPAMYKLEGGSLAALSAITERHAKTDATVFLSSEEFSRGDPTAAVDFSAIRACLAGFDEIEVLCLLRPQWQFLQSIYLEVSKTRSPPRPQMMVQPVIETGMFQGLWIDYNGLLDQIEAAFAPGEIRFLDFETCRKAPGGVMGHLLRHLEIDLDPASLTQVNGGASNVSPQGLAGWAANILSEPAPAPAWLVEETSRCFEAEFGADLRGCLFTREEFQRLRTHFEGLNKRLRQRRAAVQPGFALSAADIGPLNLFRDGVPNGLWVRLGRALVAARL